MTLLKKDVVWALCSLMDGMKEHEIQEITGLPMDACEAIWSVYIKALQESPLHSRFSQEHLEVGDELRSARRPKPPSLKQQALEALEEEDDSMPLRSLQRGERFALIRRALESLPDPQD